MDLQTGRAGGTAGGQWRRCDRQRVPLWWSRAVRTWWALWARAWVPRAATGGQGLPPPSTGGQLDCNPVTLNPASACVGQGTGVPALHAARGVQGQRICRVFLNRGACHWVPCERCACPYEDDSTGMKSRKGIAASRNSVRWTQARAKLAAGHRSLAPPYSAPIYTTRAKGLV